LTKNEDYYYNHEAVKEPTAVPGKNRGCRDVWQINTESSKEAHFAMFPPALVKVCMEAGSPKGARVLDPFFGAGTVGVVALKLGRRCAGIELKDEYADIARKRITAIDAQSILAMCSVEAS